MDKGGNPVRLVGPADVRAMVAVTAYARRGLPVDNVHC
jgi:hypothetical protein